jgi:hypothetical protein
MCFGKILSKKIHWGFDVVLGVIFYFKWGEKGFTKLVRNEDLNPGPPCSNPTL